MQLADTVQLLINQPKAKGGFRIQFNNKSIKSALIEHLNNKIQGKAII